MLHVVTASMGVRLMRGQLKFLREAGFEVAVASAPGEELTSIARAEKAQRIEAPLSREIAPLRDLVALVHIWAILRRIRPAIVNFGTPKAGLIAGLAARLSGVPFRVYTLRGLRGETATGIKRHLLFLCERISCACADRVICVSGSLRQKAVSHGIVDPERAVVLGSGSSNGVDVSRFECAGGSQILGRQLREKLGIPEAAPVVGFVGRFTRDKGMPELMEAFTTLRGQFPELRLLMVGDFEEGDLPAAEVVRRINTEPNIVCTGFVDDAAPYYAVMDILALPTYREGFPNVVLEAQAAGKPAVVTNATGAVDSVIDGVTGLIVPLRDSVALTGALGKLLAEPKLAFAMGQNGRKRAIAQFQPTRIWNELVGQYQSALKAKGLPLPVASRNSCINAVPERINT